MSTGTSAEPRCLGPSLTPSLGRARHREKQASDEAQRRAAHALHAQRQRIAGLQAIGGAPVKIVSPCEGTGYEIGSMSIVKGAKNLENAKKWYDWALSPEAQAIGSGAKVSYQVPSNKSAPVPAQAPKLGEIKLINYDFVKYGSSAERSRLLTKWDKEVSTLPK